MTAQSSSTIQAAIHGKPEPGNTLRRVNAVLGLYYDPDFDMETKALVREEFVRALAAYPDWAVQRAFDAWTKNQRRRPAPSEIVALVAVEMKPLTDELARRRVEEEEQRREQRVLPDPSRINDIMRLNGFTPKRMEAVRRAPMAGSFAEAEVATARPRVQHWTEQADPSGADIAQLAAARAANPLMQASRAARFHTATTGTEEPDL
ncbi:hypothetical protein [Cereibacter changlensis]|uniref:hypothetical protein n=1 Tax=Cereibacter changlensis TaxID=402884 RepID=UPI0040349141